MTAKKTTKKTTRKTTRKKKPMSTTVDTVRVRWIHPSIKMAGVGHGEFVDLPVDAVQGYMKRRWCELATEPEPSAPPTEVPDVPGDTDG